MRDQHSIALIQQLHPKVRDIFQKFIEECENTFDITIRIISALRTMEEQQKIYNQGRTTPGPIVTKAIPGSSYHNWGLAADVAPIKDGQIDYNYDQSHWLPIGQKYGLTWGGSWTGNFKDLDHWECKMGHNWRDLLDLYHQKKFIPGTTYVQI